MDKINLETLNTIMENIVQKKDEKSFKQLEEAYTQSVVTRSREAKMNAVIGTISVSIAKQKSDPLYEKLVKYRNAWKATKDQIVQKYGAQAKDKWLNGKNNKKNK